MKISRRAALRSAGVGGLGLAGSLGLAAAGAGEAAAASPLPTDSQVERFTLHGSGLRTAGGSHQRAVGKPCLISGALGHAAGAAPDGQFFAHSVPVERHSLVSAGAGSIQTHTFVLPAGTLVGHGLLSHEGTGSFAVTGGTGRFHAVQGSYSVEQDVDSFGGGVAVYAFTVITRKVSIDGR